jgi:hypothetical protein
MHRRRLPGYYRLGIFAWEAVAMARLNTRSGWGWAATLVATILVVGIGISGAAGIREASPECASLARAVASRSHSMFDGAHFRATERQAYGVCAADPAAFRRIVRGY